jgi:hypothetical protein
LPAAPSTPVMSPSPTLLGSDVGGPIKCRHCRRGLTVGIANDWTCDGCNKNGTMQGATNSATSLQWLTCRFGCKYHLCGNCAQPEGKNARVLARMDSE